MKKEKCFLLLIVFIVDSFLCLQINVSADTTIYYHQCLNEDYSFERKIKISVGGTIIETDVEPIMYNDRIMLPVRAVFEQLGAKVSYNVSNHTITAKKGKKVVVLTIGSNQMTVNGKTKTIDVAPFIKNNRTLVPIRACAEAFNLDVEWNETTYTAKIKMAVSVECESFINGTKYYYHYDKNGNLISRKDSNGLELSKLYYDNNDKLTHWEHFENGKCVSWHKNSYDANGNLIMEESSDGEWIKYSYDYNCNRIYLEDNYGNWQKSTFDAYGNRIVECGHSFYQLCCHKLSYDDNGNLTCTYDSDGTTKEYTYDYDYDANGNLIYKGINGNGTKYTYDDNGILIYEEETVGGIVDSWIKYTYNSHGNETYFEDSEGSWIKQKFDKNNNLIYYECLEYGDSEIESCKYTYDKDGNLIYKEYSNGNWEKYFVITK